MTKSENVRRAVQFENPEYIPMVFAINGACWQAYSHDAIFELIESHPFLFPDFKKPEEPFKPSFHPVSRKDQPYTDDFGCVWTTTIDGITGTVTEHPLADWSAMENWTVPDPSRCMGIGPINWDEEHKKIKKAKAHGEFVVRGLRHGHTFLQLSDLRGYQNLMFDFADEDPNIFKFINIVEEFNTYIVKQYVNMGADMITYAEDLGMQVGPMISPAHFRKYIKPSYERMIQPAKEKNCLIHMHSDGDIRTLIDDLNDIKLDVINLQDLVNGIDWIANKLAGRICVELDIDRQNITAMGTPKQIESLIKDEVTKIGSKKGGLMMVFGWYPGTPLENIRAHMDAMEKCAFYFS